MLDVSIIIVNYNTRQLTADCIDSIYEHTKDVDFEVILVDNASTDGSIEQFDKDSRIVFIEAGDNLGFGRANNLGYEHANGRYIFLLNSDTLLLNNAVKIMKDYMDSAENDVGCIGTVLYDYKGELMHSYSNFPDLTLFIKSIVNHYIPNIFHPWIVPKSTDIFPMNVDYITGADMMIRRDVIEKHGLFDPDFFMYYEETEMQHRYAMAGYKRVVIDTAKIKHLQGASCKRKGHSLRGQIMEVRSRFLYCDKVFTKGKTRIAVLLHLLMIPRILLSCVSWKEKRELIILIVSNI